MKYEDKMHKIKEIKIIDNNKEYIIPIYRIILDSRNKNDLKIMENEEREYSIMYSECIEALGMSFSVEYILDLRNFIWGDKNYCFEAIYFDKDMIRKIGFKDRGWQTRFDTEYESNYNNYYNNVKYEDEKNIQEIKDILEHYTELKVII